MKKQENKIHSEERRWSIEIDTELTQIFELAEEDIKMVIVTAFHMFQKLYRNIKEILKKQIKLLVMKTKRVWDEKYTGCD